MKKLLGIIVLGLLLSGNGFAEDIVLNCEFDKGTRVETKYDTETKLENISDEAIILSSEYNDIIEAPWHDDYERWTDTHVKWTYWTADGFAQYETSLNRLSGRMDTTHFLKFPIRTGEKEHVFWYYDMSYKCKKSDKLF